MQTMKAIPDGVAIFRLTGMVVVCLAFPPLLCHYVGPAIGALGASGADAFWDSQYRLPARKERSDYSFRFVAGGYGVIGMTLWVSLGRLIGVSLS